MAMIDPMDTAHHNKPLWAVYDHNGPCILACKVNRPQSQLPCIWGFSVWKRQPGYRTLGIHLHEWMNRERGVAFFDSQSEAIEEVVKRLPSQKFILAQT